MIKSKAEIRKHYLIKRKSLGEADRMQQEQAIAQQLFNMPQYQQAQSIAVYLSMPGECNLNTIIKDTMEKNKIVVAPVIIDKAKREMCFYPLRQNDNHCKPDIDQPAFVMQHCDLVLVPLVAFDKYKNRIGMGAGFYDQLIDQIQKQTLSKRPCFLGIGYQEQEVEDLPYDSWDQPLDAILSSKNITA